MLRTTILIAAFALAWHEQVPAFVYPTAPNLCRTPCGMLILADAKACREYRRFETRALRTYSRNVWGWSEQSVCKALDGWLIVPHKAEADCLEDDKEGFVLPGTDPPLCVGGYTFGEGKIIMMVNMSPTHGPLAHELVHAVDWTEHGKAGHCNWDERGVNDAIGQLTDFASEPYHAGPEENCGSSDGGP